MLETIILSALPKTWILDLDGTLVKHNGYKIDGHDTLLAGAMDFLANISQTGIVIILTSRKEEYRVKTLEFLDKNKIRYDYIIFDVPYGERILVNDRKPTGLEMAFAISTDRNKTPGIEIVKDNRL